MDTNQSALRWPPSALPGLGERAEEADFSGIRAFFRREIENPETMEILNEAFKGREITETLEWTPDDSSTDTNAFWALLGSPNGNGVQWLATENKVSLKGKGIVMIKATTINGMFTMWMLFE
ncbi:MAG: hypothetical protein Q9208_000813 [Pyrenodesmia sp. 3 TL-2023]